MVRAPPSAGPWQGPQIIKINAIESNRPDVPFSEDLKAEVRRKAHVQCCVCEGFGIDVHHIVQEAHGGPNEIENAAPLCPSCHRTYGGNPDLRKQVREKRDVWYRICRQREEANNSSEKRVEEKLDSLLRVMAIEGKVIDMGNGNTAKRVMLPNGKLGLNYTMVAEPGVVRVSVSPATMVVSAILASFCESDAP